MAFRHAISGREAAVTRPHEAQRVAILNAGEFSYATPVLRYQAYLLKFAYLFVARQDIAVFSDPKVDLEQYPTGPHLASRLLFTVCV